jgi:recombination protein RecA
MASNNSDNSTNERGNALELALGQIEKQFGRGAIMRLGEAATQLHIEAIPTGSIALDIALGVGGVPRGRITEIFGPESAGKSTLAQHIIAQAQAAGGMAAYIDVEHALEPTYASGIGVKVDELLVSQPDTGEQALEITEALVRSNAVDIIVIDSVAALVPRAEIEGEMGDALPGLQARLMSQALRKLTGAISRSRSAVIFINQLREKIGVVFGNPEVTPGGRALKFYSSVRIDLRRIETLKHGQQIIGSRVRAKVVKNKVAAPFRTAEFEIMFGGPYAGISHESDLLDLGVELGVIKKLGAFLSYGELRLGQGRENAKAYLRENPSLTGEIEREIRAVAGAAPAATPAPAPAEAEPEAELVE